MSLKPMSGPDGTCRSSGCHTACQGCLAAASPPRAALRAPAGRLWPL